MVAQDLRLAALTLMSLGVMLSRGTVDNIGLALVIASILVLCASLRLPQGDPDARVWAAFIFSSVLCCSLYLHIYGPTEALPLVLLAAGTAGGFLMRKQWARSAGIAVAIIGALGLTVVEWTWGRGIFDVFWHVQNGAQAILQASNPYSGGIYDWIPSGGGAMIHGWFHPPYGPPVFILAAPARFLGDVRVMAVVMCMILGLALWLLAKRANLNPGRVLLLFISSPFLAVMVLNAWVDVYTMAGLGLWLALRPRFRVLAIVALAIALAVKPTNLLIVVPALIWSGSLRREILFALGTAVVIDLPFALATGLAQFDYDTLGIQFEFPERFDALTVDAVLLLNHLPALPWTGVIGLALYAILLVTAPRPRDLADLLVISAAGVTTVFIFSKWAFFNYYYLSAMVILLAIASSSIPLPERETARQASV